jgi:hypothetical protein
MLLVHLTVKDIFDKYSQALNVTSGRDSADGRVNKTLHDATINGVPAIFAIDYSSVHITDGGTKQRILQDLKTFLPFCDVVLHSVAGSVEHFHIEFDPKNDKLFQDKKELWKAGQQVIW